MNSLKSRTIFMVILFWLAGVTSVQARLDAKSVKSLKKAPARAVQLRKDTAKMKAQAQQRTQDFERKLRELSEKKRVLKRIRRKYKAIQRRKTLCNKDKQVHINRELELLRKKNRTETKRLHLLTAKLKRLLLQVEETRKKMAVAEKSLLTTQRQQQKLKRLRHFTKKDCGYHLTQQQKHNLGQYKSQKDMAQQR